VGKRVGDENAHTPRKERGTLNLRATFRSLHGGELPLCRPREKESIWVIRESTSCGPELCAEENLVVEEKGRGRHDSEESRFAVDRRRVEGGKPVLAQTQCKNWSGRRSRSAMEKRPRNKSKGEQTTTTCLEKRTVRDGAYTGGGMMVRRKR